MKSYADGILIFILIEALSDYLFYLALAANNDPFSGPALITVLVLDYFSFFVSIYLSMCRSLCVCASVYSYSQVFKCELGSWVRI